MLIAADIALLMLLTLLRFSLSAAAITDCHYMLFAMAAAFRQYFRC